MHVMRNSDQSSMEASVTSSSERVPHIEPLFDDQPFVASYSRLTRWFAKSDYEPLLEYTLKGVAHLDQPTVLELGPGPGWIAIFMAKRHATMHVTGVDISDEFLQIADKNKVREGVGDRVTFVKGDAGQLHHWGEAAFDAVVSNQSLHYWDSPRLVLNEIAHVLKPGAIFCIGDDRRDLTFAARIAVGLGKWFLTPQVRRSWMASIAGCYTAREVEKLLDDSELKGQWELRVFSRMVFAQGRVSALPANSSGFNATG